MAAFNNESFLPVDLAQFQALQRLPLLPAATVGPATVGGSATGEGSLDVDYVTGVGEGQAPATTDDVTRAGAGDEQGQTNEHRRLPRPRG